MLGLKLLMARSWNVPAAEMGEANTKAPLPLYLAITAFTPESVGVEESGRFLIPLAAALQVTTSRELATYAPGQKRAFPEYAMDAAR